jgi:hypothetical protein
MLAATAAAAASANASANFEKGTRRSVADYKIFRDRKTWNQFQRGLLVTAHMHGVGDILDVTLSPPTAPAELDLWDMKEGFLFSVFTTVLVEPTAAEIIRRYSEYGTSEFGKSHLIYRDLKNAMENGVSGKLRLETLEVDISKTFLDKHWTKGVTAYMTRIGHLLSDHYQLRDATVYADSWYIAKLNASFKYH